MLSADERITLELIQALKENEQAAGKYYAACAIAFAKHRAHWLFMQGQEEDHAVILEQVEKDFQARPHRWKRGKILPATVRFISEEVKNKTALVASQRMNEAHAVTFSIDFESSLVEKELLASIITSDPEFEIRMVRLRTETENHRQRLQVLDREIRA